jgi:hypothetical protein
MLLLLSKLCHLSPTWVDYANFTLHCQHSIIFVAGYTGLLLLLLQQQQQKHAVSPTWVDYAHHAQCACLAVSAVTVAR